MPDEKDPAYLKTHCLMYFEDPVDPDEMHRCQAPSGCAQYTAGEGVVRGAQLAWWLCKSHRNKETLGALLDASTTPSA